MLISFIYTTLKDRKHFAMFLDSLLDSNDAAVADTLLSARAEDTSECDLSQTHIFDGYEASLDITVDFTVYEQLHTIALEQGCTVAQYVRRAVIHQLKSDGAILPPIATWVVELREEQRVPVSYKTYHSRVRLLQGNDEERAPAGWV